MLVRYLYESYFTFIWIKAYMIECAFVLQVPVSIADLGGTEIDLRFGSSREGRLFVIVAPVRRFSDGAYAQIFILLVELSISKKQYCTYSSTK